MANYNCLMIDLDGTLLDFDLSESNALVKTFEAFEIPVTDETINAYKEINRPLWKEYEKGQIKKEALMTLRWNKFLTLLGKKGSPVKMNEFYMNLLANSNDVIPGALEFLSDIEDFATVAVITNGSDSIQKKRIVESGVVEYVDGIFISDKMGISKPDKRFVNIALDRLGVTARSKVLIIGDSLTADIGCGVNAELDTCWCNFRDEVNDTNLAPTFTVRGFEELKTIILTQEEMLNIKEK